MQTCKNPKYATVIVWATTDTQRWGVGTNNIIPKVQQVFQPLKVWHKMCNLMFFISEVQSNFCNELFDSVKAQCKSTSAEQHYGAKSKSSFKSKNYKTQCKYRSTNLLSLDLSMSAVRLPNLPVAKAPSILFVQCSHTEIVRQFVFPIPSAHYLDE